MHGKNYWGGNLEGKKTRKHAFDQESDQEKKKENKKISDLQRVLKGQFIKFSKIFKCAKIMLLALLTGFNGFNRF